MNRWFTLPRMGKETFSDLMRSKVKYDSKFGFMFTSTTNLERALSIISSALNEQVLITSACFICEGPLEGGDDAEGNSSATICLSCQGNEDALDLYRMRFVKLLESL